MVISQKAGHPRGGKEPPAGSAAQDWLPIQDLREGCLFRPDGGVVAGVLIAPYALTLKSDREVRHLIAAFQAALNSLSVPWQILSVGRPVDLDIYLQDLDQAVSESDARRKPLLREYVKWVSGLVRSGQTTERRYYLLLTRYGADAVGEHRATLRGLLDDVGRIGLGFRATVMSDADWRDLLRLAFDAQHAAHDPVPLGRVGLPPVYRPEGGNDHQWH